ncbi:MAG: transferrin-binding protein-like solute binding protein [Alphaproteobacteria bacterium]|nr:transferrin-binding protein-like solute binding protein [Alphaproteobacteria bacterium]
MKNFILKSGLVSLAAITLVASGTTTTAPEKINLGYTGLLLTDKISISSTKANVVKIAESEVEVTISDKKYKFDKTDLENPDGNNKNRFRKKIDDDSDVDDIYIDLLNRHHKGVQIWYVGIGHDDNYEQGYVINGDKPVKMPTDIVATYEGRLSGSMRNKTNPFNDQSSFYGDIELEVDFNNNSIAGSFYDVKTWDNDQQEDIILDGGADITSGVIAGDKFTATITTDETLNTSMGLTQSLSGEMSGGFYGYYGTEMAGIAVLENDKYSGLAGFDANKEFKK